MHCGLLRAPNCLDLDEAVFSMIVMWRMRMIRKMFLKVSILVFLGGKKSQVELWGYPNPP